MSPSSSYPNVAKSTLVQPPHADARSCRPISPGPRASKEIDTDGRRRFNACRHGRRRLEERTTSPVNPVACAHSLNEAQAPSSRRRRPRRSAPGDAEIADILRRGASPCWFAANSRDVRRPPGDLVLLARPRRPDRRQPDARFVGNRYLLAPSPAPAELPDDTEDNARA